MQRTLIGVGIGGVLVAGVLVIAGVFGGGESGDESEDADCAGEVGGLVPTGSGADAYTMGIRVNQASDVNEIHAAIGDRVEARDVFLINTEFAGTGPSQWQEALDQVEQRFPCNRIASLNGLGTDPNKAGYMKALATEERVDVVMLDWEPDTWESAGRGRWDSGFASSLSRINQVFSELQRELREGDTRMGIVPDYLPPWDYGRTARVLGQLNWELDSAARGFQIVQTQPNCGDPSAAGPQIGELAQDLRNQYRPLFALTPDEKGSVKAQEPSRTMLEHLGSRSPWSTPNRSSTEAVSRTGPEQAASCSKQIVDSGGAGILYWADADALKAMLETPDGRQIRPPGNS